MILVEEAIKLQEEIKPFYDSKYISVDTETLGLNPHQADLRLIQIDNGAKTLVIDVRKVGKKATSELLRPLLEDKSIIKVLHNAKFDLKFIKHHLKIDVDPIFDTFLASILISAGVRQPKGYHGLEQTLYRYTEQRITKDEQVSNWGADTLSTKQLEYAANDAKCLLPLREAMIEHLKRLGLVRCAKLEFDCVLPVAYLELCGFHLDIEQWMKVAESQKLKADELAQKIYAQLQSVIPQQNLYGVEEINLNSHVQIKEYFTKLGVPMPESTREYLLEPLYKDYPIVEQLVEYRGLVKSNDAFGETFREFVNPATGRIHADFMQIGAEATGRFSVGRPNLQQIPSDKEHRNCFKPADGNKLICADYSQIELRILADLSQDPQFIKMFASGDDFHTIMAAQVFRVPKEKVTSDQRYFAKRLNFGIVYGIGAQRFAMQTGLLESEARIIMDAYFDAIPKAKRWLNYQKWNVLSTHSSRTASGRLTKYVFDPNDRIAASKVQRNAKNHPLQGSSADILKRALRLFYDATRHIQEDVKLVNIVHDEINVEVREDLVEEVSQILHDTMIEASTDFLKTVNVKVDVNVRDFWEK